MAKIKCEYCDTFIDDTQERCDNCGAVNSNHKRVANDTPKTIEELQAWYVARKLPPEHITRFFIGKDIREPKAFGIYEQYGKFIVYKNKADGTRAVRYEGTDEAYAVNEIYLKLKEEILKQKSTNLNRKKANNQNRSNSQNRNYTSPKSYSTNSYSRKRKKNQFFSKLFVAVLMLILSVSMISGILSVTSLFSGYSSYYISENESIYYREDCSGPDIWWLYDEKTGEWSEYATLKDNKYPDGLDRKSETYEIDEIAQKLNVDVKDINIIYSKNYIDAGNHQNPTSAYYYHNGILYYYLNDTYSSYGSSDNSGWYIYEDDEWSYYCSVDDKEKLGDDLWYADRDYNVGTDIDNIYDFDDELSETWNPTSFEDTSWYQSYESNVEAYKDYRDSHDNDYDNDYDYDSDYDWDSGDYDWDSGGSDWDSDW